MKFIEHNFGTLPQFIQIVGKYWNELGWIFRGQVRDAEEWPLLPKAGRPEYFSEATPYWKKRNQITNDLGDFHTWRESAIAFTNQLPTNDFECLAYAQHYGLATRLLDWSTNPLVALFFAVESDLDKDGVVICYNPSGYIDRDNISLIDCPAVACVKSRPFDRRIAAQSGIFTYHPLPHQALLPKAVSGATVFNFGVQS
jgi:hypothetical protein